MCLYLPGRVEESGSKSYHGFFCRRVPNFLQEDVNRGLTMLFLARDLGWLLRHSLFCNTQEIKSKLLLPFPSNFKGSLPQNVNSQVFIEG